jgi:hypothetical protein
MNIDQILDAYEKSQAQLLGDSESQRTAAAKEEVMVLGEIQRIMNEVIYPPCVELTEKFTARGHKAELALVATNERVGGKVEQYETVCRLLVFSQQSSTRPRASLTFSGFRPKKSITVHQEAGGESGETFFGMEKMTESAVEQILRTFVQQAFRVP